MLRCNKKPSEDQMASKKTTTHSAEPIDTALATGVEAMKEGFEFKYKLPDEALKEIISSLPTANTICFDLV